MIPSGIILALVFSINGAMIAEVPAWNGSILECQDRAKLIELLLNDDRRHGRVGAVVHVDCQYRGI